MTSDQGICTHGTAKAAPLPKHPNRSILRCNNARILLFGILPGILTSAAGYLLRNGPYSENETAGYAITLIGFSLFYTGPIFAERLCNQMVRRKNERSQRKH